MRVRAVALMLIALAGVGETRAQQQRDAGFDLTMEMVKACVYAGASPEDRRKALLARNAVAVPDPPGRPNPQQMQGYIVDEQARSLTVVLTPMGNCVVMADEEDVDMAATRRGFAALEKELGEAATGIEIGPASGPTQKIAEFHWRVTDGLVTVVTLSRGVDGKASGMVASGMQLFRDHKPVPAAVEDGRDLRSGSTR